MLKRTSAQKGVITPSLILIGPIVLSVMAINISTTYPEPTPVVAEHVVVQSMGQPTLPTTLVATDIQNTSVN
jgi:hypothetical protein